MLPVVVGSKRAARIVFASTLALVAASMLPVWFGAGPIYFAGAASGGAYFVLKAWRLSQKPSRVTAMGSFFGSLVQLGLLLAAASIDGLIK
jgi:protoheme IX farnesyltransferase